MRSINISTIALALCLSSYAAAYTTDGKLEIPITSNAPPEILANSPAPRCTTQNCLYFLPTPPIRRQLVETFISKHLSAEGKPVSSISLAPGTTLCVVCNGGVLLYKYTRYDGSDEHKELTLERVNKFSKDMLTSRKRVYVPEGNKDSGWTARILLGHVEEDWVSECAGLFCPEEGKAGEWTEKEKKWLYGPYPNYGGHRELK